MTPELLDLLNDLENAKLPFERRFAAVQEIGREVLFRKIEISEIPLFYQPMVDLWRGLDLSGEDRGDKSLIETRTKLATICNRLSLQSPEGQKFFKYFPRVKRAEGFASRVRNKLMVGEIKPGYGASLYEFHWEYPIEGAGVRKDLISVITDNDERIPLLDWCRQNDLIVFCNRCGLDITYEVSRDCPYRN
jgi:hypothetical protein